MKKIVHIIHSKAIGGVEVAVNEYSQYLPKTVDYYLFCIDPVNSNYYIRGNSLFDFKGIHNPLTFIEMAHKILTIKPDIIVTSLWKSHLLGLFFKTFVYRQASYCGFLHSSTYFHIFDSFFSRLALKNFQYFIFDSQASYFFSNEVKTKNRLKNWIVPPVVKCMEDKVILNKKCQTPYRFCFMGRIAEVKNLKYAIRIIDCLQSMGLDVLFDIYGEGKQQNEINKLILGNSNINCCGFIRPEDVIKTMAEYDFYLQCSRVEGLAISVIQALSSGLVCFLTPVGEIANYTQDGENAVHLSGDDFQQDADKVLLNLKNLIQCNVISNKAVISVSTMPRFTELFDKTLHEMSLCS